MSQGRASRTVESRGTRRGLPVTCCGNGRDRIVAAARENPRSISCRAEVPAQVGSVISFPGRTRTGKTIPAFLSETVRGPSVSCMPRRFADFDRTMSLSARVSPGGCQPRLSRPAMRRAPAGARRRRPC